MNARPPLSADLVATEFARWYWLKAELLAFCRQQGLPTAGGKRELAARIAQFLATGAIVPPPPRARSAAPPAPDAPLTAETVIWPGFRAGQRARAFFLAEIGPGFHFDQRMRDFLRDGAGHTLGEAVADWHAARAAPRRETAIAPQFEYNRHLRAFFKEHPGASRAEARAAWHARRARPTDAADAVGNDR